MAKLESFDPDKVFFTADLHFGHEKILEFTNRPCRNLDEMTDLLMDNWNSKISNDSTTFILGDVYFGKEIRGLEGIIRNLNGVKYLIKGNHDYFYNDQFRKIGFYRVLDYQEILVDKQMIVLSHYPMVTWNRVHRGSWMFHGHVHGTYGFMVNERKRLHEINEFIGTKTMDVGIDSEYCSDFSPFSYRQIEEIMKNL